MSTFKKIDWKKCGLEDFFLKPLSTLSLKLCNYVYLKTFSFRDYCQKLALALTSNPKTSFSSLSLNGNSIEDRGMLDSSANVANNYRPLWCGGHVESPENKMLCFCTSQLILRFFIVRLDVQDILLNMQIATTW